MSKTITEQEITEAQHKWGDGIVAIGQAFLDKDDFIKVAKNHLDTLYGFEFGIVLFKPTKASKIQFRPTREGALSYFIGENSSYPEDRGFALQPWSNVRFENYNISIHGDHAIAMGNYFFMHLDGTEVKVEYTFGYIKTPSGELKIYLHHSSLPYSG